MYSFLDNIDRITANDYTPSSQDILRSRQRTSGVHETIFMIDETKFRFVFRCLLLFVVVCCCLLLFVVVCCCLLLLLLLLLFLLSLFIDGSIGLSMLEDNEESGKSGYRFSRT